MGVGCGELPHGAEGDGGVEPAPPYPGPALGLGPGFWFAGVQSGCQAGHENGIEVVGAGVLHCDGVGPEVLHGADVVGGGVVLHGADVVGGGVVLHGFEVVGGGVVLHGFEVVGGGVVLHGFEVVGGGVLFRGGVVVGVAPPAPGTCDPGAGTVPVPPYPGPGLGTPEQPFCPLGHGGGSNGGAEPASPALTPATDKPRPAATPAAAARRLMDIGCVPF
nr:hypothetical protein [Mycobacterium sp. 1245499.0]